MKESAASLHPNQKKLALQIRRQGSSRQRSRDRLIFLGVGACGLVLGATLALGFVARKEAALVQPHARPSVPRPAPGGTLEYKSDSVVIRFKEPPGGAAPRPQVKILDSQGNLKKK